LIAHGVLAQSADEQPLEGAAYVAADEAYKAYEAKSFAVAAEKARQAITDRPDLLRLRLLLIEALLADAKLGEAKAAILDAQVRFDGSSDLKEKLETIRVAEARARQIEAQEPASDAYRALAAGKAADAIAAARRAVERVPDSMSYRLLLLNALLTGKNEKAALEQANAAVALDTADYVPLVWRGYVQQKLGNRRAAVADFAAALALPRNSETDRRNIRLIAADAALVAGDAAAAEQILRPLPRDGEVSVRADDAAGALARRGSLPQKASELPAPVQDCPVKGETVVCVLAAAPARSVLTALPAPANLAYEAQRTKNYPVAIREARRAVADEPQKVEYRLLLVNLLLTTKQFAEAEAAADAALAVHARNAQLLAARGFARSQSKKLDGAIADWEAATAAGLPRDQERNVRLSAADAALSANRPDRAVQLLASAPPGYETAIRKAYAFEKLKDDEGALAAFREAADAARAGAARDGALRGMIAALVRLQRKEEARALLARSVERGDLRTVGAADMGYLAASVGEEGVALASFDRARANGELPASAALDAGYAAKRQFENRKAADYLAYALDRGIAGDSRFDQQRVFDLKREAADLLRTWGVNTSVSYGKVGAAPNPFSNVIPTSRYTAQFGSELYWRPEAFSRNGSTFDVFGRLFQTLYEQSGGATGMSTTQGMVGARWKPFADHNLVLEVDRLFKLGNLARNDTLLRAAYSLTQGTDIRVVDPSWLTWTVYAEIDKFIERSQLVAIGEARVGQSFRLDAVNNRLVFFPHAVFAANYDDSYAVKDAFSAGAGASLRYWFGETPHIAPPSYLELTLQYRFRVAGDRRAEGIFAQVLLNY
jgi:hypothetical protein